MRRQARGERRGGSKDSDRRKSSRGHPAEGNFSGAACGRYIQQLEKARNAAPGTVYRAPTKPSVVKALSRRGRMTVRNRRFRPRSRPVGVVPFVEGVRTAAFPSSAERHRGNSEGERNVCVGGAELDARAIAQIAVHIANCREQRRIVRQFSGRTRAERSEYSTGASSLELCASRRFRLVCPTASLHARLFPSGRARGHLPIADRLSRKRAKESN